MRAVVQRVTFGSVDVEGETIARIDKGLVVLVGVTHGDSDAQAKYLASKIVQMRIFADNDGKFNRSALEVAAEILLVSQFTLYGDARKGRRPNFVAAAAPAMAESLIELLAAELRATGLTVASGRFGASMLVKIHNDGPVTIILAQLPQYCRD